MAKKKQERSARSYQHEIRKLKDLLRSIEYVQQTYNGHPTCPVCEEARGYHHHKNCGLLAAIQ